MPKRPNFYALLGILRTATQEEIRRAYLKAAKRLHPDTNSSPGETELFLDVQQAYQILSDTSRRSAYDATLSPEDDIPTAIAQRILISRRDIPRLREPQLVYVLMDISPSEERKKAASNIPLNLCLVLDCSTSMKGEKMDTVKATAAQLIRKLKPEDVFSVVSFSDRAEVIIPATRQGNQHRMETKVQMLQPFGGTEILQGLRAGFEEVKRYASPQSINHIIILTDGRTYGDEQQCYELAQDAAEHGIGISGLGIGSGWNDIFLDQLANLTGGSSMFVSQPKDIDRLLNDKFNSLKQTFAEGVSLEYQSTDGVEVSYAFRLQPDTTPLSRENPMPLGPILMDWPLSVLFEFRIKPQSEDVTLLTLLHGKMEVQSASSHAPIPAIPVNLAIPVSRNPTPEPPPASIVQALSKLTLYRIQEKARAEVAAGDYGKATEHLQKLATHLLVQGERSLAKTILLEVEHIEREKSFSESGDKLIKYGTRSLFNAGE